jgi:hypothetical protein
MLFFVKLNITINVPVVYMARYIMVLMRARSITRGIGRSGPWKIYTFWALKWIRARGVQFGSKKVEISRADPFHCPE